MAGIVRLAGATERFESDHSCELLSCSSCAQPFCLCCCWRLVSLATSMQSDLLAPVHRRRDVSGVFSQASHRRASTFVLSRHRMAGATLPATNVPASPAWSSNTPPHAGWESPHTAPAPPLQSPLAPVPQLCPDCLRAAALVQPQAISI